MQKQLDKIVTSQDTATQVDAGVDFVIVTALREELNSVLDKLPGYSQLPPTEDNIWTYYQATIPVSFPDNSTGEYRIIVTCFIGMGRVQATIASNDAIKRWHPRYILLIGIAGGIANGYLRIGDILIADQVVDYELQKITPKGPEIRWKVHGADARLLDVCNNFLNEGFYRYIKIKRPNRGKPAIHIGPIASGDKVIAYKNVLDKYQVKCPELLGVEMEAAGVATAAFQSTDRPCFFMVRCISDLADKKKDSNNVRKWRAYACDVAASFAIALLRSGPIPLANKPIQAKTKQVQLIIEGQISKFSKIQKKRILGVLAALLDIDQGDIKVLNVFKGSIGIKIEMPDLAADRLCELAMKRDVKITKLGIKTILIDDKEYIITSNKRPEQLKKILLIGEPMLDITENISKVQRVRTLARHDIPYQFLGEKKSVLGGVFFVGRFLGQFCQMDIAYPRPTAIDKSEFQNLCDDLSRLKNYTLHPGDVSCSLFKVRRTFRSNDSGQPDEYNADTLLRVESKMPANLNEIEEDRFLEHISSVIESKDRRSRYDAIVIADYDLGLFSQKFVKRLSELFNKMNLRSIPIIVYTGRTWRKYTYLQGCYIVSDYNEALGDLGLSLKTKSDNSSKTWPFHLIAESFPHLGGAVLVKSRHIYAGWWKSNGENIRGGVFNIDNKDENKREPVGYRVMVASWLALGIINGHNMKESLEFAHGAAKYGQLNLIDKLRFNKDIMDDLYSMIDFGPKRLDTNTIVNEFATEKTNKVIESGSITRTISNAEVVKVRICYSPQLENAKEILVQYLSILQAKGFCHTESDQILQGGENWREKIQENITSSDLFILLPCPDFFESKYYKEELEMPVECKKKYGTQIVPVIYRGALPRQLEAVAHLDFVSLKKEFKVAYLPQDTGLIKVTTHLIEVIQELHKQKLIPTAPQSASECIKNGLNGERIKLTEYAIKYYINGPKNLYGMDYFYRKTQIPVLAKKEWLRKIPIPVKKIDEKIKWMKSAPKITVKMRNELLDEQRKAKEGTNKLYNGDLYRFLSFDGDHFVFCPGKYYDFLSTGEFLGWELAQKINPGSSHSADKVILSARDEHGVDDFRSSCTSFGTCALVIAKNKDGNHKFLLNKRSEILEETPGLLHVIPAGTFQPPFNNGKFVRKYLSFTENIFREFIEELVDDELLRGSTENDLDFKDLLNKKALDFYTRVKEGNRYCLWHLGTVVDPVNLKPEILTVMIIDESDLDFKNWTLSWETETAENVFWKDFSPKEITTMLDEKTFVPTGRAHLQLVLQNFNFLKAKLKEFKV